MTAITVTEISYEDVPQTLVTGTSKRRVKIYFRGTVAAGGSGTHDLSANIPGLADIEGVVYSTDDNANTAYTNTTWSTTTITVVAVGAAEVCLIGTLT